jgi:hypothetical protein
LVYRPRFFKTFFPKSPSLFFWSMALRRIDKKKAVAARTARPRAVAIAARQAFLARTQRNIPDYSVADPPESPAIQAAPLLNLSVPKSQLTSGLAVMSLHPAPVLPASAEIPASTEIPVSAEIPVSTEIPASAAIPRTIAPLTQYVRVGEKAPKLSAIPSRQQAVEITQLLLSKDIPFTPVDVVHQSNYLAMETSLMKKFATDPPRRDDCAFWTTRSNQRFCRELLISVPDNAVSKSDKLGFVDSIFQVALESDLKDPSPEQKTDEDISRIVYMFPNATPEIQLEASKILIEKLPVEPVNYRGVLHRSLDRPPSLITVNDFRFVWLAQLDRI